VLLGIYFGIYFSYLIILDEYVDVFTKRQNEPKLTLEYIYIRDKYNMYSSSGPHNSVTDYNKLQGTTNPADLSYQIRREIGARSITVENSAQRPISVAITTYVYGHTPDVLFSLPAGHVKHLGINSQGSTPQYIWILGYETGQPVSQPTLIRSNSNQLVLRDGINEWFVHFFRQATFAAAK
jgi:hypothetical protein